MPKTKDIAEKELEKKNDVFADIVNAFLFHGETVVKPEELVDVSPASKLILSDGLHEQERDVSKLWMKDGKNVVLSLYGFENQTKPDADIAFRCFAYDGASYKEQVNQHKSKMGKPLPPYPVITLVLYFGAEPWNTPRTLFERLGDNLPDTLRPYLSDYRVNLIEVARLSRDDIAKLNSDFQLIAKLLSKEDANRDEAYYHRTMDHPEELLTAMSALTDDSRYINEYHVLKKKKEDFKMCDILDQVERRGEERAASRMHNALYQSAVRAFQQGNDMAHVKIIFRDLSPEELKKAMEESKLPQ